MLGRGSEKRKRDDDESSEDSDQDSLNGDTNSAVIYVHIFTGKTLCLKVKLSDTIGYIKTMIQRKEGISLNHHLLILNDTVLEDNDILADFNIDKSPMTRLTLMPKSVGLMRIFIKKPSPHPFYDTFSLEVKPSETIDNVKQKIYSMHGYPIDEHALIFNETILDDSGTLADFHIKTDFTLTLFKSGGWINIFIKNSTMGTINQRVKPTFTVSKLKEKVQSEVRIPANEQALVFNDMVLDDNSTLADFYIGRDDTLTVIRKSSGRMEIFVKMASKIITMNVKPSHTVRKVKTEIERNEGIPLGKQRLIFSGRFLENDGTLARYGILKESHLHLVGYVL